MHRTITPASPMAASPSPISKAHSSSNPRKRGRTACTRCKTRKQKCDEQWPVCSNCQAAGTACDKKAVANHGPSARYTRALEERVQELERSLAAERRRQSVSADVSKSPSSTSSPPHNAINEIVTMIPLGNLEAPAFVGPSSGLSMALNLGEMVQATIWNKAFATAAAAATAREEDIDCSPSSTPTSSRPPISLEALMTNSAKAPPSDALGRRMVDTYLHQLHPRYPFIDRADVWRLHDQRHALAAAQHSELSREQRFGVFKLYMVYAIGATLIALTDKRHDRTTLASEGYYLTALQHVAAAREPRTIQNVEAMILLALYHLRESSCHGMWYMVGLAMRTCIDLGMHRAAYEAGVAPPLVHRRRLLFWTVYSLDRTIAMSLGRPLSIMDRQIDVGLPEDPRPEVPESTETADRTEEDSTAHGPATTDSPLQGSLFIQLCRLKRIESQVHLSIYRVDKPVAVLARKIDRFYAALEAWKAALPPCFHDFSEDKAEHSHYLLLHYNRVLRLLLQPFLAVLPPSSPYYARCLRAAGAVCRAHKQLHQTPTYAHSFISVQTVFMAGVTLLYALWTRPQAAWSAALADDLRSCSLVLFVMGERAAWVRKFRDTFERLVSAAMEKLQASDEAGEANDVGDGQTTAQLPTQPTPVDDDRWNTINTGWPGSHMNTPQDYDTSALALTSMPSNSTTTATTAHRPAENESWRMVEELATWIARDNGVPDWMPDLEMLPNLWSG